MRIVDADVMIDLLRGHPPAFIWQRSLPDDEVLALLIFTVMELIYGCHDKLELRRAQVLADHFVTLWPTDDDCHRALEHFPSIALSHRTGVLDAITGETAVGLGVPLLTFNTKHFDAIPNLSVEQPYER